MTGMTDAAGFAAGDPDFAQLANDDAMLDLLAAGRLPATGDPALTLLEGLVEDLDAEALALSTLPATRSAKAARRWGMRLVAGTTGGMLVLGGVAATAVAKPGDLFYPLRRGVATHILGGSGSVPATSPATAPVLGSIGHVVVRSPSIGAANGRPVGPPTPAFPSRPTAVGPAAVVHGHPTTPARPAAGPGPHAPGPAAPPAAEHPSAPKPAAPKLVPPTPAPTPTAHGDKQHKPAPPKPSHKPARSTPKPGKSKPSESGATAEGQPAEKTAPERPDVIPGAAPAGAVSRRAPDPGPAAS